MTYLNRIVPLVLLLVSTARATTFTWTADSTHWPYTLGSSFDNDTILFGENISSPDSGFYITGTNVVFQGNGKTFFYGTAAESRDYAFAINGNGCKIYDLNIVHDPSNDGDDADDPVGYAASPLECTGIALFHRQPFTIKRCSVKVFGYDVRCLDSYGWGSNTKNVTIDSCHFWNYSLAYASRNSYGGASVRVETHPSFSGSDFAVHITNSVSHKSSHNGFAVIGKTGVGNAMGVTIENCTTYTDAWNTYPGAGSANAYGINTHQIGPPIRIAHNAVYAGTTYGGSRGIMCQNWQANAEDVGVVCSNYIEIWLGPDSENPSGIARGIRLRGLSDYQDYIHVFDNTLSICIDNSGSTTHIGAAAVGIDVTVDDQDQGFAHITIENNHVTIRSLSSSGVTGYAGAIGVEGYTGTPPITVEGNTFISSDVIFGYNSPTIGNGYTTHDLTLINNTFSFLPAGDSGYNLSDRVTYEVGYSSGAGTGNKAINAQYDTTTGATDTDILLAGGAYSHDLTLTQRVTLYAVGNDDSLIEDANFRVVDGKGTTLCNGPSNTGDTTVDCRYWKTYGTGSGSDSNFNSPSEFDIIVKSGTDSTVITDTFINWRTTCIIVDLAATSGTLPFDSCQVYTAPSCPIATPISPPYSDTIEQHIDTLYADITLDAADDTVIAKFLGGMTSTPTTVLLTDTIGKDTTNWRYIWTSLVEDSTYYWRVVAADDDCVDTTAVWHFHVDSVKAVIADTGKQGIDGVTLDGVQIGALFNNIEQDIYVNEVQTDGRYEVCCATGRRGTACYPDWCAVRSDW